MVEEFDRIFKRFLLEQLEKEHRPFEELSLNFVFLTPTGLPRSTRLELASKPMALIKNRLEIEKIFKKVLKPTGPINIETSIRYDYFSDGQYYDKEAFDLYDNLTGFWRVKSTFVRNINLLIPVKTSRDVNVYEYRDNYVFELSQNGDLETLLQRLKIVALKQSSVNRLISFFKDTSITGKIETSSVFKISGRIRRWRALREAQYFIKSIKYAINNINLQIKQEYLEEFKYVLNRLVEGVHDINHLVEDEEFMIRFYKYNRETIYDSTYIYGEYRFAFALLIFVPLGMPIMKHILDTLKTFLMVTVLRKQKPEKPEPPLGFLPILDSICLLPMFFNEEELSSELK